MKFISEQKLFIGEDIVINNIPVTFTGNGWYCNYLYLTEQDKLKIAEKYKEWILKKE